MNRPHRHRWQPLLLAGLFAAPLGIQLACRASEPGEQLRRSVPAAAVVCLEILQPQALLDPLLSEDFAARVEALPLWPELVENPKFQELRAGIGMFQVSLATDWRTALRELTGGGALFAAAPGDRTVLLTDSLNPDLLKRVHELAVNIARGEAEKRGEPDVVRSDEQDGLARWTFNGVESHVVSGSRLVAANDSEVLEHVLAAARGPKSETLAGDAGYAAARTALGDPAAMLFLNLRVLRHAPGFLEGLEESGGNPLAALLIGGLPDSLKSADWLAAGLYVAKGRLSAQVKVGPGENPVAPPLPLGDMDTLLPDPRLPGEIAALRLNRDLHSFYSAKDDLFPARTSGLIFFENMMGIFFSGRNLTDEIMAAPQPEVSFVVARQDFADDAPAPEPQLPGFALVLRLRDPEAFRPVLEEAWQKALGLINFTRGQKAEPGLILDRPRHGGIAITTSHFSTVGLTEAEQGNIRFNFQPTLAMPGEFAILSSSESVARRLVDSLTGHGGTKPISAAGSHTRLTLHGGAIRDLLRLNFDAMVRNNMIEEGHTREEAEMAINLLLAVAGQVNRAEFGLGGGKQPPSASLTLDFAGAGE
ncbi:MAG: hypothetical protein H7A46_24465 [Verrucomicrobiales bacterium]|nr:hypothetical protein [Verrucomicrobiales bacterium]